ncbi:hypothetical protein [Trinickia mobilis]|uniref:hypothetical protein n=1 Tax=Trinickia mobilis TaxID=2816356 RepID=UPI001A8D9942|nr:hypothetical protein [Trinickia mobilis]
MDIIELAVASGMAVTLDARIGTQEYRSVHGTLDALRRFAEAVLVAAPINAKHQGLIEADGGNGATNAHR